MNATNKLTLSLLSLAIAACSFNDTDTAKAEKPAATDSARSAALHEVQRPGREHEAKMLMAEEVRIGMQARKPGAPAAIGSVVSDYQAHRIYPDRERYSETSDNPVKRVSDAPMSTFSIDVDAASFSLARRFLKDGRMPPVDAIRSEEIINALAYKPMTELSSDNPVGVDTRIMATPWNAKTRLLQVRLNAWEPDQAALPDSNYVFLIDVSGSMQGEDRLGLLKRAFSVMLTRLNPTDTVALVTYAAGSTTVLEPTSASNKQTILLALDALTAGGSTHASDGIQRACGEVDIRVKITHRLICCPGHVQVAGHCLGDTIKPDPLAEGTCGTKCCTAGQYDVGFDQAKCRVIDTDILEACLRHIGQNHICRFNQSLFDDFSAGFLRIQCHAAFIPVQMQEG